MVNAHRINGLPFLKTRSSLVYDEYARTVDRARTLQSETLRSEPRLVAEYREETNIAEEHSATTPDTRDGVYWTKVSVADCGFLHAVITRRVDIHLRSIDIGNDSAKP